MIFGTLILIDICKFGIKCLDILIALQILTFPLNGLVMHWQTFNFYLNFDINQFHKNWPSKFFMLNNYAK